MSIDRAVFVFAGFVILIGVALAHYVNPWWILLSVAAGLNMIQGGVHRLLSRSDGVQEAGPEAGTRLPLVEALQPPRAMRRQRRCLRTSALGLANFSYEFRRGMAA